MKYLCPCLERCRSPRCTLSSAVSTQSDEVSFLKRRDYFSVWSSTNGTVMELWPAALTLMLNIPERGEKFHYHWRVVRSLRKHGKRSLTIEFLYRKLEVEFGTKWERRHFVTNCIELGRVTRTRGLRTTYPVKHDQYDSQPQGQDQLLRNFLGTSHSSSHSELCKTLYSTPPHKGNLEWSTKLAEMEYIDA